MRAPRKPETNGHEFIRQQAVLANGLRITCVPMPGIHSVAMMLFVGLGSRFEPEQHSGAAHLIEHMLFKGTVRRPSSAHISQTLDAVGGILNASTDKELTTVWAKVAREHTGLGIDLIADMVRSSRLTPADVRKEKQVVVEELRMLVDDPQDRVHVLVEEALWPGQPVGREIAGTPDTVASLSRKDLRHYMSNFYGSTNAVLSVAGAVELEEIVELGNHHFGDWAPVQPPPANPAVWSQGPTGAAIERKTTEQVQLCVAFPAFHRSHPDRAILDVLCTILGGGSSSRLFTRLRDRLGLAYDVHAYTTYLSDVGSLVIYAGAESNKIERVLNAIMVEVESLRRRRVPESELQRTKDFMRGRLWLGLEDPQAVANWFGSQEMLQHDVVTPEQAADDFSRVTAGAVRRVARDVLHADVARLVAVGDVKSLALPGMSTP
ncbi:MAG: pitrilysin family protein [Chloroflexota bacterium]